MQRTVVIELDSVEHAKAAHDSDAYQAVLAALGEGADGGARIVEALPAQALRQVEA